MKPKKIDIRYICPQCGFVSTDRHSQYCQKCDGVHLQTKDAMFRTIKWLMQEGLIDPEFRLRRAEKLLTFMGFTRPEGADRPWTHDQEEYWL